MRHVVLIGANGQLGTDLRPVLRPFKTSALTRADLDVCNAWGVEGVLRDLAPDVVINTSAFHRVDLCEDEPEQTFAVNATGAYNLAQVADSLGFTLVHFSTDYVFDGRARVPYKEGDRPNPLSVYGASKLAGEYLVGNFCRRHFVIRTTGLYGVAGSSGKGGNFVETMVRLAKSGARVRVVDDQVLTPTATVDLAAAVARLLEREEAGDMEYGLYHITNAGSCSWYEFAAAIFELCGLDVDLAPISSSEAGFRAARPAYSVLDHGRWTGSGFAELRPWKEALGDYLARKGYRDVV